MSYWSVPPEWYGDTCYILAGGPSLKGFDPFSIPVGGRIIVVNNSFLLCPFADVLYFCDRAWWLQHRTEVEAQFTGQYIVTIAADVGHSKLKRLRSSGLTGLDPDPGFLRHGCNSGYQAICLAYHFGAKRIVLLGYDMHVPPGGETHWHGGHKDTKPDKFAKLLEQNMLPRFASLVEPLAAAGVEVVNATPGSALTCWPMVGFADVLEYAPAV